MASSLGLEPKTVRLEGGSSIQLSYDDTYEYYSKVQYQFQEQISAPDRILKQLLFHCDILSFDRQYHIAGLGTVAVVPDRTRIQHPHAVMHGIMIDMRMAETDRIASQILRFVRQKIIASLEQVAVAVDDQEPVFTWRQYELGGIFVVEIVVSLYRRKT